MQIIFAGAAALAMLALLTWRGPTRRHPSLLRDRCAWSTKHFPDATRPVGDGGLASDESSDQAQQQEQLAMQEMQQSEQQAEEQNEQAQQQAQMDEQQGLQVEQQANQ